MNKTLIYVYITGFVIGVSYGLHNPILPVFAKDFIGASYSDLGLIGLSSFLPYVFIPIFIGILLDRFNNGYLLMFGSALNAYSVYLLSVAQSVPEIMGIRIMSGMAHAFFWPPCTTLVSDHSSTSNRVRNISTFTIFFVTGFMIGPLFGTILLEDADITYRILFQITALVLASSMITALLVTRTSIRKQHDKFNITSIKEMRRFPEVVIMVLFYSSIFGIILALYPAFLHDHGISDTDIFLLYFIFGISRLISLAFANRLAKRFRTALISALLSVSIAMLISVPTDSVIMFVTALLLLGFGISVLFPLSLEIVLRRTKKAVTGTIIGAYETIFGIGMVLGPTVGGPFIHLFGSDSLYIMFGIIGLGVTILIIIYQKRLYLNHTMS